MPCVFLLVINSTDQHLKPARMLRNRCFLAASDNTLGSQMSLGSWALGTCSPLTSQQISSPLTSSPRSHAPPEGAASMPSTSRRISVPVIENSSWLSETLDGLMHTNPYHLQTMCMATFVEDIPIWPMSVQMAILSQQMAESSNYVELPKDPRREPLVHSATLFLSLEIALACTNLMAKGFRCWSGCKGIPHKLAWFMDTPSVIHIRC